MFDMVDSASNYWRVLIFAYFFNGSSTVKGSSLYEELSARIAQANSCVLWKDKIIFKKILKQIDQKLPTTQASFDAKSLSSQLLQYFQQLFCLILKCNYWLIHFLHWGLHM